MHNKTDNFLKLFLSVKNEIAFPLLSDSTLIQLGNNARFIGVKGLALLSAWIVPVLQINKSLQYLCDIPNPLYKSSLWQQIYENSLHLIH